MVMQGISPLDSSMKSIETRLLSSIFMDYGERLLNSYWMRKVCTFSAIIIWNILHGLVTIGCWLSDVVLMLESYLITYGLIKKYKSLDLSNLRYLAIVVESEEAHQIKEVIELLNWVASLDVKHVSLYDREGLLKDSQDIIMARCKARPWKAETAEDFLQPNQLTLEFLSSSDGKEGVVKAANFLFMKYKDSEKDKPKFTEQLLDEALQLVGFSGPDPDFLLIYGPTRCHLGFPAWRLRYTEIVHMGHLKSKRYGSVIKAIYRFTTVRQNYGK